LTKPDQGRFFVFAINIIVHNWAHTYILLEHSTLNSEGKFLVAKFVFGESFGMSLEGDCHEVEVTPNFELLVTNGMSLEGFCNELYT
jgi:hypothetical protein